MLLMLEVLKVHTGPSIQSNVTHVKGVESAYRAPKYRVMLLMSEVSKVLGYIACVKYCEQRIKCYVC